MNEHAESGDSQSGKGSGNEADNEHRKKPGTLAVALSVIAAAFGVQSEKNRERDFSEGNPVVYIVAGLVFTILFVLTLVGVVMLVLP